MLKLNLGCGTVQPEGWVNVDYSFGARLTKIPFYNFINKRLKLFDIDPEGNTRVWDKTFIHDLNKRFPWNDNSVDIIYTSHTLEHFSKEEGLAILKESCRVLKKGGIIRIVVPDLAQFINEYNSGKMRSDEFVKKLGVLYESRNSSLKNLLIPVTQFPHKCMYDSKTLVEILNSLNLPASTKNPFESDIPDIKDIELPERTVNAVIVEGKKI